MRFALENQIDLINRYSVKKESIHQIAESYKCYPNKILRALKFLKVSIRNKSESTKVALDTGRKQHPTKGVTRSIAEKISISEGRSKAYENLTDAEKERISNIAKERWKAIPDDVKENMRKLANEAIRLTSKNGSNLEIYLHKGLVQAGYDCYHHQKILENMKLEVDLFIPKSKIAIEIDGPAHFLPIWGKDNLEHHIKADKQKNGLLTSRGCSIIRIQVKRKSISDKVRRDILTSVINNIKKLEETTEPKVIYLEVK